MNTTIRVGAVLLVDNWQAVTRNYLVNYRYNGHD